MVNHMKKIVCFLLLLCLFILSSCHTLIFPGMVPYGDVDELYSIMAVTFIPSKVEYDFDEFKIIETDGYGRKLFVYFDYIGVFAPEHYYWAFVCQSSDDTYSYFYEDLCCQAITPEQSKELKRRGSDCSFISGLLSVNDWQKPVDKTKCSKVRITNNSHSFPPEIPKVLGCEENKYSSETEPYRNIEAICADSDGNQLYMCVEKNISQNYYLIRAFIINGDRIIAQTDIDFEHIFAEIHEFKQSNGFGATKTYTVLSYNDHTKQWLG